MDKTYSLALVFFVSLIGPSCQITAPPGHTSAIADHGSSLSSLAGTWKLSHFGPPTVSSPAGVDPAGIMRSQLEGSSIVLGTDGSGSMIMLGQARKVQLQVVDETDAFVKVSPKSHKDGGSLVYDKAQKTLMMPTILKVGDTQGVLPTYFRR